MVGRSGPQRRGAVLRLDSRSTSVCHERGSSLEVAVSRSCIIHLLTVCVFFTACEDGRRPDPTAPDSDVRWFDFEIVGHVGTHECSEHQSQVVPCNPTGRLLPVEGAVVEVVLGPVVRVAAGAERSVQTVRDGSYSLEFRASCGAALSVSITARHGELCSRGSSVRCTNGEQVIDFVLPQPGHFGCG